MERAGSTVESESCAAGSVLFISQFYWPEPIGVPLYVTDAAQWFVSRGNRVTVLTGRPYYPAFRIMEGYEAGARDRECIAGVEVMRLPTIVPRNGGVLGRVKSELNFLIRSVAAIAFGKMGKCDRVVSFCPSIFATLAGALAVRRGGQHVAVVFDIQSGLASGLGMVRGGILPRMIRAVERFALNRVDHVVVISDKMKDALVALGVRTSIDVIPIWVDESKIYPLPGADGPASTLLYSGNLGRKQGLDQILDLAEVLADKRPDVRFLIRGNGSQDSEIRRLASERSLANLEFQSLVPAEKLNEGLADGDIHLVPQIPDGADFAVPSKVYNIMAAGRPFICTATSGSPLEVLSRQAEGSICVRPNDPQAFADAVISLLDDPERRSRMGRNGRRYVETEMARDAVMQRYAALLG